MVKLVSLMQLSALLAFFSQSSTVAAPDPKEPLLKQRIVLLGSPIDDAAGNDVIAKLLFLDMESSTKPIQLVINSPGGLVLPGLAILDTIEKVRAPVATHCIGTAHSMAAVILAHGRAGARTAEAGSTMAGPDGVRP